MSLRQHTLSQQTQFAGEFTIDVSTGVEPLGNRGKKGGGAVREGVATDRYSPEKIHWH